MEVIKGNLLLFITIGALFIFLAVYAHEAENALIGAFDFYRKRKRKQEYRLVGKLIAGISFAGLLVYYLLCSLLKQEGVPPVAVVMIVLVLDLFYELIFCGATKYRVGQVLVTIAVVFLAPVVLFVLILNYRVHLDMYYRQISLGLFLLDILLFMENLKYWKKGDF